MEICNLLQTMNLNEMPVSALWKVGSDEYLANRIIEPGKRVHFQEPPTTRSRRPDGRRPGSGKPRLLQDRDIFS